MRDKRIKFVPCRLCGEPFELRRGYRQQEYCRDECKRTAKRADSIARARAALQTIATPVEGCWEYRHSLTLSGYGRLWVDGKTRRAHRVAWELTYGPIPDGIEVCHRCDNPPCVRPDHLFLGTAEDNAADREAKGRSRGGKPRKLSTADRAAIRAQYAAGGVTKAAIARAYGVTKTTIGRVIDHHGATAGTPPLGDGMAGRTPMPVPASASAFVGPAPTAPCTDAAIEDLTPVATPDGPP
jgi:hypothetical protein